MSFIKSISKISEIVLDRNMDGFQLEGDVWACNKYFLYLQLSSLPLENIS